jgi:hypothetical protein
MTTAQLNRIDKTTGIVSANDGRCWDVYGANWAELVADADSVAAYEGLTIEFYDSELPETFATEYQFYAAVKQACDAAGIDERGRGFVECYCAENGADCEDAWGVAISTLHDVADQQEGLQKVAANQSPWDAWEV